MSEVYLNNKFIGNVEDPLVFTKNAIESRRKGKVSKNVSVFYNSVTDSVMLESGKGRVRRPLIVVKAGKAQVSEEHIKKLEKKEMTFSDLAEQGAIEYVDAAEEENCLVAFYPEELTEEHTHLEISPLAMVGLCTSLVPYGNFNQSTRLNAGSKNQKQAIGFYTGNYSVRMDMDINLLHQPQTPLVKSIMHDISHYDEHPSGQNVVVAVLSYKGYNMEDAIVMNKDSVDRGLARSTYYRPLSAEELRYSGGLVDEIGVPNKEVKGYKSERDYRFLEEDGIIYPEATVGEGDVVLGKTSPPRFLSGADEYSLASDTRRESSVALSHGEEGVVDFVMISENEEGNKLVQVRVRDTRIPEIGDKFTSRHGQKGVIGMMIKGTDMPFTTSGVVPDLLFSPHGIPSRMTISHLIELIGGKVGALGGRYIDGTTFDAEPEEAIRKQLMEMGFREDGLETLYNGRTGKRYKAKIYVGNMYYLKLKHMVANKLHSRARGPIQLLTRQPTEGRAKEGGLRLGEMEKDTFVAHGASLLLKERFDSDRTILPISEQAGIPAVVDEFKKKSYCHFFGETAEISNVEMAYAFKLLLDELKSLCIYPKLVLKNKY